MKKITQERMNGILRGFHGAMNTEYTTKIIPKMICEYLIQHPKEAMEKDNLIEYFTAKIDKARIIEDIKSHARKTNKENLDIAGSGDFEERLLSFHGGIERMADSLIEKTIISSMFVFIEGTRILREGGKDNA